MTLLLDDQPVSCAGDKLQFDRLLKVIDQEVLSRPSKEPFVVGLFGRWGSGKSSLLKMLGEHLHYSRLPIAGSKDAEIRRTGYRGFRRTLNRWLDPLHMSRPCRVPGFVTVDYPVWIVVEFSPWAYRQEKNLLIPLLACLAKQQPVIEKLVKAIVRSGPELVKTVGDMGSEFAKNYGLPLLGFLQSLNKKGSEARDLVEQIADAVKSITHDGRKIAFLIDDLDRCHDPAQIVGLLEQIKLFLHLPNCLFFIAADRDQIIRAIDTQFPGEGVRYLEKFVQLAVQLPQADPDQLGDLLPSTLPAGDRTLLNRTAAVLGYNPRKFKAVWNRAHIALQLMNAEAEELERLDHRPALAPLLRWLLLQEAGLFQDNPYSYLDAERVLRDALPDGDGSRLKLNRQRMFSEKLRSGAWDTQPEPVSEMASRLEVYLWQENAFLSPILDSDIYFRTPRILAWYAKAAGTPFPQTRQWLEQAYFQGRRDFVGLTFLDDDFSQIRLHGANLRRTEFWDCDLRGADLFNSDLTKARFKGCILTGASLDDCKLIDIEFDQDCLGLEELNMTNHQTYEQLLNLLLGAEDDNHDENAS